MYENIWKYFAMLYKKVLSATTAILDSLRRAPSLDAAEESKLVLEETIQNFQDLLKEISANLPLLK